jgi:prevent-host-death family protein
MKKVITATEASRNLSDYLNRVAYGGETFVIKRGNKVVAQLIPAKPPVLGNDLPEIFANMPRLSPEEAEAFARDIEEGRDWLRKMPHEDPWESS